MSMHAVRPAEFIPEHNPPVARVTYANGEVAMVAEPRISGDTLRGTGVGTMEPVAVALDAVKAVQVRGPDRAKTALLATGLVVLAGAGAYFASQAGTGGANLSNCGDKDPLRGAVC